MIVRAKPRPWTPSDIATAARIFSALKGHAVTKRLEVIAATLNRTYGSIDGRHNQFGDLFEHSSIARSPVSGDHFIVPATVIAERDKRLAASPRDLTAFLCGDPLPGRSALDGRA